MHSTKSAVLLLALAISASCVVATPHLEFLDGIFDDLNRTGQHIISGFLNATKNGTVIAEVFLENIRNSSAEYYKETLEFAQKIEDAVHTAATEGIANFSEALRAAIDTLHREIGRERNVLQRETLKDALARLQTINASVIDLKNAVNNLNDRIRDKKKQYSAIIQEKWTHWTDAQLERVDEQTNGVGNEEAKEIIDELISRYSGYLHSCLEELQAQKASYEQNVNEAIVKYYNATTNLTADVVLCAESNLNFLSCHRAINKALGGLSSAPAELDNLKQQGIEVLATGLSASGCVGQTLAEYELEKPSVERELDDIITRYQEQQEEETATTKAS